jgi:hypothetical protein
MALIGSSANVIGDGSEMNFEADRGETSIARPPEAMEPLPDAEELLDPAADLSMSGGF